MAMLAARNWVFCAPLWVGDSVRLVRLLLFRRVRAALGRAGSEVVERGRALCGPADVAERARADRELAGLPVEIASPGPR
jgi:hypothetical protein